MTMQKANSTIQGYKDVLSQHVTPDETDEKSHTQSRDGSPSTVRFTKENDECSFPYSYVQYVRFMQGDIVVRSSTAKIIIQGKNLRPLYLQLERYKTDAVTLSPKNISDNGQPIVDVINIIFDED